MLRFDICLCQKIANKRMALPMEGDNHDNVSRCNATPTNRSATATNNESISAGVDKVVSNTDQPPATS